jgi:hypothetical protein
MYKDTSKHGLILILESYEEGGLSLYLYKGLLLKFGCDYQNTKTIQSHFP